jgi:hypothetical protein
VFARVVVLTTNLDRGLEEIDLGRGGYPNDVVGLNKNKHGFTRFLVRSWLSSCSESAISTYMFNFGSIQSKLGGGRGKRVGRDPLCGWWEGQTAKFGEVARASLEAPPFRVNFLKPLGTVHADEPNSDKEAKCTGPNGLESLRLR